MNQLSLSLILLIQLAFYTSIFGGDGKLDDSLLLTKKPVVKLASDLRMEEERLFAEKINKAIYSEAAMHAYEEVMTREFDFKEASYKEADAFLSPEMYEMKVLSDESHPLACTTTALFMVAWHTNHLQFHGRRPCPILSS